MPPDHREPDAPPEDAADAATEAKAAFVAHMSHELRTPLTAVLGAAQLLATTDTTEEQAEYVETITKSGKVLLGLIDDVLDYSKMQAGSFDLVQKSFDVHEALDDAVETQRGRARGKALRLHLEIATDVPPVAVGDPLRLKQIVINLVSNAVKYTREGHVAVRATVPKPGRLRVSVHDTGPGVPEALLPRLFEPFSRIEAQGHQVHGTGLGLAITRQIAERLGGEVGARSAVGEGSEFWFEGPAPPSAPLGRPDRHRGPISLPPDLRPVARRGRILVAEDNRFTQQILTRVLERLGHEVRVVADGAACIEAVETETYDLVLMDGQMPRVDGYTAAARIRELGDHGRRIPIVALTANAAADARQTCLAAGMDDYLRKPFVLDDVADVVGRWLDVARERRGLVETAARARPGEARFPALDDARLEELAGDDAAFREELITIFLEDVAERLEALADVANNEDQVRSVAHAIKGACGNFGARAMEGIARGLCRATRVEPPRVHRAVGQLRRELGRVAEATGRTLPPEEA
ncbi:MAG: ATP-binding protein [Myxococcota bacterium]